jgi:2-oxoglutarate ferredoxin oxidoreductase subunit delta
MTGRGTVVVDKELCKGCYLCIRACPMKVLEKDEEPNSTGIHPSKAGHTEKCIACCNCYEVCPDICIEIYELEGAEV